MTDPDQKQLEDLAKATIVIFTMLGEEAYFLAQTRADNPEIGASEMIVLTITRKHLPPQHPISVFDGVLVGMPGMVTEF